MPNRKRGKAPRLDAKTLNLRARWVIDYWDDHPEHVGRYAIVLQAVRLHFMCGKTAGEQAIKQAHAVIAEGLQDQQLQHLVARRYITMSAKAEARGDLTNARKNLDSLRNMLGMGAPNRHAVAHSGSVDVNAELDGVEINFDDMTDEEIKVFERAMSRVRAPAPAPAEPS